MDETTLHVSNIVCVQQFCVRCDRYNLFGPGGLSSVGSVRGRKVVTIAPRTKLLHAHKIRYV